MRAAVKDECAGLPDKLVDKISRLVVSGVCPTSTELLKSQHSSESDPSLIIDFTSPTEVGNKLQDFVESVYDDVMAHCRAEEGKTSTLRRRTSGGMPWHKNEGGGARIDKLSKEELIEKEASEAAEKVEGLICTLLYNRYVTSYCRAEDQVSNSAGSFRRSNPTMHDTTRSWHHV